MKRELWTEHEKKRHEGVLCVERAESAGLGTLGVVNTDHVLSPICHFEEVFLTSSARVFARFCLASGLSPNTLRGLWTKEANIHTE